MMHLVIFVVEAVHLGAEGMMPPKKSFFKEKEDLQTKNASPKGTIIDNTVPGGIPHPLLRLLGTIYTCNLCRGKLVRCF